ncbi:MAG: glycosyltransferase family 4 protein [Candidatus Woesearchaeota archaeon]
MKVLMFGWEFPPYFAGGVGTVCAELSKALSKKGVEITYVMPYGPPNSQSNYVKLLIADQLYPNLKINIKRVPSLLTPYLSSSEMYSKNYQKFLDTKSGNGMKKLYGENLLEEIYLFAEKAALIAQEEDFDVIHAHDYTTFPAAILAKRITGKPLAVHIHITQFDITGGRGADPRIYEIEKEGMMAADVVIAISDFVKNRLMQSYGIPESKIRVVHNAVEFSDKSRLGDEKLLHPKDKIVLFLGRVTLQKGPDYFVEAAKKVLEKEQNVKFIIASSGDMLPQVIERAAQLGIIDKFIFTGRFVSREEGDRLYKMADVFVMPSVSEPFGIVALEAMYHGTPVIVSKQSGVSEVIQHCLKVDFWDVNQIASNIIAALRYKTLSQALAKNGMEEACRFDWAVPAAKCLNIYNEMAGMRGG